MTQLGSCHDNGMPFCRITVTLDQLHPAQDYLLKRNNSIQQWHWQQVMHRDFHTPHPCNPIIITLARIEHLQYELFTMVK